MDVCCPIREEIFREGSSSQQSNIVPQGVPAEFDWTVDGNFVVLYVSAVGDLNLSDPWRDDW